VIAIRREPLDGGHGMIRHILHDGDAGRDGFAVDMHGTGATEPRTAPELGSSEGELIAQIPHEWHLRIPLVTPLLLVYFEFHLVNPPSSLKYFWFVIPTPSLQQRSADIGLKLRGNCTPLDAPVYSVRPHFPVLFPSLWDAKFRIPGELRLRTPDSGIIPLCEICITNAVLLLHGAGQDGETFLSEGFAGAMLGLVQSLDALHHFLVLPDSLGNGKSSKPSDDRRLQFPHYSSEDIVLTQYRLVLEHLGVNHLRLIVGNTTGRGQAWSWGSTHPYFVDALVVIDSLASHMCCSA
jgi:hypothetical protein